MLVEIHQTNSRCVSVGFPYAITTALYKALNIAYNDNK